jgi:hypothetical protein
MYGWDMRVRAVGMMVAGLRNGVRPSRGRFAYEVSSPRAMRRVSTGTEKCASFRNRKVHHRAG